ncbi:MAG TPA: hypothetical protein VNU45_10330 [Rummeliibacillus sp.]|nr:hypothetical protein [Rummeliibacillus sp.]
MVDNQLWKNINRLLEMYNDGLLGGESMPEDALSDVVSKEELPNILTLGMALNYQRNSYALWKSVTEAYKDEDTRWIFSPTTVVNCNIDTLREALLKHRVGLQPNSHPDIWYKVAKGIQNSSANGDILDFIESAGYDVANMKNIIQIQRKREFPYLSGPKIFNYWLYVMEGYTNISWKSRELITIAPDTHILQSSVKLGLCSENVLNASAKDREFVADKWNKALLDTNLAPIDVHTPLWLWSRAGFPSLEYP